MNIAITTRGKKLADLCKIEGYSLDKMLELSVMDSVCKGICTNPDCSYTTDVEGDQQRGWCDECETNTVKSALVLAGLI